MTELSIEQQQAIAIASAKRARAQQTADTPESNLAPSGTLKGEAQRVVGGAETALQFVTAGLSQVPAGLAGIIASVVPGGKTGPEAVQGVSEALTFKPRTEAGQLITAAVSEPLSKLEQGIDTIGEVTGDPEDTLGATAVKTALLGGLALVGLRTPVASSARAAATPKPRTPNPKTPKESVPSVKELLQEGGNLFKIADEAGVVIRRGSAQNFARSLQRRVAKDGIDEKLHPKADAAIKRITQDSKSDLPFQNLETLRKIAKDVAGSLDRSESRFGQIISSSIDDYIAQLGKKDVSAGNARRAAETIKEARNLWARARKGEVIEELIDRAGVQAGQFTGSGFENALRTQFRQLSLNKRRLRGFTKEEIAAIRRVAKGDPAGNALRFFGKMAPRGVVSTALTGAIGGAIGGPTGSIAALILGEAARRGATSVTRANARKASELVRSGGGQ